jgi:acyl transferase domain-containing protein/acyl-CoA synthetase (AMP-forming)/AMP-acid ligase II/acyl carrier protein
MSEQQPRRVGQSFRSFVDLLVERGRAQPNGQAFVAVLDGQNETDRLSYGQLERRARVVGGWLQQRAARGERILLLFPPGLEFLEAFCGTLYAGAVAVPAPPPEEARLKRTLPRLRAILEDARPTWIFTSASLLPLLEASRERVPELAENPVIATRALDDGLAEAWVDPRLGPETLAYLQYTSGSTSSPKGVMVRHGNLLHNSAVIARGFGWDASSRSATWMPYFHDFGLVEGLVQPIYAGVPGHILSPLTLLRRPGRWLEVISRYRITHSSGPNFALEHVIARVTPEEKERLDLSCWRFLGMGAEPIRTDTLERFVEAFAPCGFRREALNPGYGLAEATLIAAMKPSEEPLTVVRVDPTALDQGWRVELSSDDDAREVVSCGCGLEGTRFAIVEPSSRAPLGQGRVGEVWVESASVGAGYWQRPEESAEVFGARTQDGDGPFLRTGDLGFLHQGELYVTGRLKDLIIVRGQNHYPQDIEATTARAHPALKGSGAAFSVEVAGEERLVIVQEAAKELGPEALEEALGAIRLAVLERHDLAPHAVLLVRAVLKTSSGKVQRRACRQAFLDGETETLAEWREPELSTPTPAGRPIRQTSGEVQAWLAAKLAERAGVRLEDIDPSAPFAHYGLDSLTAVRLAGELEEWTGSELSPTLFYEHPTLEAVCRFLTGVTPASARLVIPTIAADEPIAIVGLACRFPGAADVRELWQLLAEGREAVAEVPSSRWDVERFYDRDPDRPGKSVSRRGGFIAAVDRFDATFFGITRREAMAMDPQQRLVLEVAWEAFEEAGIPADRLVGSATGVFLGISTSDYGLLHARHLGLAGIEGHRGTGTALSIAANRLSHLLGLQGPSLAIDTACSSSLVALHLAAQSLRLGECELALAGGVNLMLAPDNTIVFSKARMLSPTGRCHTFDASADGYVRGEGCGFVVLKRWRDAQRDGDTVLALLRGSAVNQDGLSNGLTAPNGEAQEAVIRAALAAAAVDPLEVGYVEAHGTGTALGDPIEMSSIAALYCRQRTQEHALRVGSIKTNLGHLEPAAGIAGLIKVVLALGRREIPPHLHFEHPSPHIPWHRLPVVVPRLIEPWPEGPSGRRLAGVSSFGFGGTNAHVLVEEAPARPRLESAPVPERPLHVLPLSARSESALRDLAGRYSVLLATGGLPLEDVAHSAATSRSHLAHRLAVVAADGAQAADRLRAFVAGQPVAGLEVGRSTPSPGPAVAFLFTGQGAQRLGMGRELYEREPSFRATLQECEELLSGALPRPLLEVMLHDEAALGETLFAQPALFALELALARLWQAWGVRPAAVLGHSVGELAAACVAGSLSVEGALRLVATRAQLMQASPAGAMVAVDLEETVLRAELGGAEQELALAAINGPRSCVVSGGPEAVGAFAARLAAQGVKVRPLAVSRAFHSSLLDPLLDALEEGAREIPMQAPVLPWVSNLSGSFWSGDEAPDALYWRRQAREPVRFAAGVASLVERGIRTFLEIGPSPALLPLVGRMDPSVRLLPSLRTGRSDWQSLLESLAALHCAGVPVDWPSFDAPWPRRRVALPTYPFQRERFWLEPTQAAPEAPQRSFLGTALRSPHLGERKVFEAQLAPEGLPFLTDHRVYDRIVVSGATHLARAVVGGLAISGGAPIELAEVGFAQALVLEPGQGAPVQLSFDPAAAPQWSFEIHSPVVGSESWRLHASGKLHAVTEASAPARVAATTVDEIRARCTSLVEGPALFAEIERERKIALGPTFAWLERVWRRDGEALAQLRPARVEDGPEVEPLHPGLADGFFQLFAAAVPTADLSEGVAYVPAGVEAYRFWPNGGAAAWCHARIDRERPTSEGTVSGEVRVWDAEGKLLVEARGVFLRRAQAESLLGAGGRFAVTSSVPRWTPLAEEAQGEPLLSWLVVGSDPQELETFGEQIAAEGGKAECVTLPEQSIYFGNGSKQEFWSLDEIAEVFRRHLEDKSWQGVAFLAAAGTTSAEDSQGLVWERVRQQTAWFTGLVRALSTRTTSGSTRLVLVTRGARAVVPEEPVDPAQAALWGLAAVVRLEHPELACRTLDLEAPAGEAARSAVALLGDPAEPRLASRRGQWLVERLEPSPPSLATSVRIRPDASYLITGGGGALGLRVASWLVAAGARHLVLLGRQGGGLGAPELAALEAAGARVLTRSVDVADEAALLALLAEASTSLPPVAGIVHAAGVVDDRLLRDLDGERLERVLWPKVAGAWALHRATRGLDLDFFVLFGSLAGALGSAGQGSYAAGNAFLDGLAHARRAWGLPALSLDWGPWASGMALETDSSDRARWQRSGLGLLAPEQGLALLGQALASPAVQAIVAAVDWRQLAAALPVLRAMVAPLAGQAALPAAQAVPPSALRSRLDAALPEARAELLVAHVRTEVGRILRLDRAEALDRGQPLMDLGLDSLMTIELRDSLSRLVGRALPATLLFKYPTIAALANFLEQELWGEALMPSGPSESELADAAARAAVAELSQAEALELLSMELDQLAIELVE